MSDFNIRSDSVDVEQIMNQIRARISEKRGVDYTEQQIRELAQVKLEKILDPRGVRSALLEAFRRQRPPYVAPTAPLYVFEDTTLFESRQPVVGFFRRLLRPVLKLFFNVNLLIQTLHNQAAINKGSLDREIARDASRHELDDLYFEIIHNLVVELTRLGIESKNLRMQVESLSSRVEFNERRARALESVVAYKPSREDRYEPPPERAAAPAPAQAPAPPGEPGAPAAPAEGPGQRSRRRRRRRGRRGGQPAAAIMGAGSASPDAGTESAGESRETPDEAHDSDGGADSAPPGHEPASPPGDDEP